MEKECNKSIEHIDTIYDIQINIQNNEPPQIITIVDLGINAKSGFAGTGDDGCPKLSCCPGHCAGW